MKYDVIVVGAGPAGLFAAMKCAEGGLSVLVLESNSFAGKKLLITGQGKCNLTNTKPVDDFINCYGSKRKSRFVRKCIYSFSNIDLIDFFNSKGLRLEARSDGKVFPVSENSADVLNLLMSMCNKIDVSFEFNSRVSNISKQADSFTVESNANQSADTVIITTGGFTFPGTGSKGDGFRLAESLGHSIVTPRPSLTGVIAEDDGFEALTACAGISIDCGLLLYRSGSNGTSRAGSYAGRLLFTHTGISGPLIIDNSRDFLPGDELRLNLFPEFTTEQLEKRFIDYCSGHGKSMIKSFFTTCGAVSESCGLPDRLVSAVFQTVPASVNEDLVLASLRAAEVSAIIRKKLISAFTSLPVVIKALEGKNKAMCTAGGINIAEINPGTMESRIVKGLFFAGEVIDVDGDSGGYNLQFAFSSAYTAAGTIINLSDTLD